MTVGAAAGRELWVVAELGPELIALPHRATRGAAPAPQPAPAPFAPDWLEGLIAIGGDVVALIDGGRRLFPDRPELAGVGGDALRLAGGTALRITRLRALSPLADAEARFGAVAEFDGRPALLVDPAGLSLDRLVPETRSATGQGWAAEHADLADAGAVGAEAQATALEVTASGRRLAVDPAIVVELVDRPACVAVPGGDPAMPGVVVLRGAAVAALDAGVIVGAEPCWGRPGAALIVAFEGARCALLIDRLIGRRAYQEGRGGLLGADGGVIARLDPASRVRRGRRAKLAAFIAAEAEAQAPRTKARPRRVRRLLELTIGGRAAAVPVDAVIEVVESRGAARAPRAAEAPAELVGVIEARGGVAPCLMLAQIRDPAAPGRWALLETPAGIVALAIDGEGALIEIAEERIQPFIGPEPWAESVASLDDRPVPILSPARLADLLGGAA